MWFLGLIIIGIGVLSITKPEAMFALRNMWRSWQFRDAEPTDDALSLVRFSGGVEVLIGVGLIIWSLIDFLVDYSKNTVDLGNVVMDCFERKVVAGIYVDGYAYS